jgi:hypothetical protein
MRLEFLPMTIRIIIRMMIIIVVPTDGWYQRLVPLPSGTLSCAASRHFASNCSGSSPIAANWKLRNGMNRFRVARNRHEWTTNRWRVDVRPIDPMLLSSSRASTRFCGINTVLRWVPVASPTVPARPPEVVRVDQHGFVREWNEVLQAGARRRRFPLALIPAARFSPPLG